MSPANNNNTSSSSSQRKLQIYAYAVEGMGHVLGCVGALQPLLARGHEVTFIATEAKFRDTYERFGYRTIMIDLPKPPPPSAAKPEQSSSTESDAPPAEHPMKQVAQGLLSSGFLGPLPILEKMKDQLAKGINIFAESFASMPALNEQLEAILSRDRPDAFVVDAFVVPPAILKADLPWIFLCSAQPLCILPRAYSNGKLPPYGAGFPTNSKPEDWAEYLPVWREYRLKIFGGQFQEELLEKYDVKLDYQLNDGETLFPNSPYLNLYGYLKELDYSGNGYPPLPDNYVQVDAFMRQTGDEDTSTSTLPEEVSRLSGDKVIYFSLGSLGSVDVELMLKVARMLTKERKYKVIVSKGPLGETYELPENAWGESFLPQTKLLPLVDLVVTHGGNNTVTEALSFGRPLIVLPLFGDQLDNAQRIEEMGYGVRLEPYTMTEAELLAAVEKVLGDKEMKTRLEVTARRLQASNSKELAADRIEQVVEKYLAKKTL